MNKLLDVAAPQFPELRRAAPGPEGTGYCSSCYGKLDDTLHHYPFAASSVSSSCLVFQASSRLL